MIGLIWPDVLFLCGGAYGWLLLTRWGNSESAFFGVRVTNKFEGSFEAGEIESRYVHEIIGLTALLVLVSLALQTFFTHAPPLPSRYRLWPLEFIQAVGVRIAYARASKRTLRFAARANTVRTADISSLTAASPAWNWLYWPSVYLPLVAVPVLALKLKAQPIGALSANGIPSPSTWPLVLTANTGALPEWFARTYRLITILFLLDIAGVLFAHALAFHSRINEWGEEYGERRSYRKLLMMVTVASTWFLTATVILIQTRLVIPPRDASSLSAWTLAALIWVLFLVPLAPISLLFFLYYRRPAGAVSLADDRCWKFGLYYFNPKDDAWIVPTRFGAGITFNFGQPLAWGVMMIFGAIAALAW